MRRLSLLLLVLALAALAGCTDSTQPVQDGGATPDSFGTLGGDTEAVAFEGTDAVEPLGAAMDATGNLYVVGTFEGKVRLGGTTLFPHVRHATNVFVTKLDPAGRVVWASSAGGYYDHGYGVAVDAGGDVLVTGRFEREAHFGGIKRSCATTYCFFVAKYSGGNGQVIWLTSGGGRGTDANIGYSVTADPAGDVYVAGSCTGSTAVGSTVADCGAARLLVARLSGADGRPLWARIAGGPSVSWGADVALGRDGAVHVVGAFAGDLELDAVKLSSSGTNYSPVVIKLTASTGDAVWGWSAEPEGFLQGDALAVDEQGRIHVAGQLRGEIELGGVTLRSSKAEPKSMVYVAFALSAADRRVLWAQRGRETDGATMADIELDGATVHLTGAATDGDSGATRAFHRTLRSSTGNVRNEAFGEGSSGSADSAAAAVALVPGGRAAVVGSFSGTVKLGHTELGPASRRSMFVWQVQ
jgi:hypothetical protein